jgi:hypothetical protein
MKLELKNILKENFERLEKYKKKEEFFNQVEVIK